MYVWFVAHLWVTGDDSCCILGANNCVEMGTRGMLVRTTAWRWVPVGCWYVRAQQGADGFLTRCSCRWREGVTSRRCDSFSRINEQNDGWEGVRQGKGKTGGKSESEGQVKGGVEDVKSEKMWIIKSVSMGYHVHGHVVSHELVWRGGDARALYCETGRCSAISACFFL